MTDGNGPSVLDLAAARLSGRASSGRSRARRSKSNGEGLDRRQLAAARLFVQREHERIRFCPAIGLWYVFDGRVWKKDELGAVRELAKATADVLHERAEKSDSDARSFAREMGSRSGVNAMLELARTDPAVAVAFDAFDARPHLLSALNGTIDLRNGSLRPHAAADLITRLAPTEYFPNARHADFDRVLEHVVPDAEARAYLQRAVGYGVTGETSADAFFLLVGAPRSGKGALFAALRGALGPGQYIGAASMAAFCVDRHGGGGDSPRSDLFALLGVRLVEASEISPGLRFDDGLMKRVTGGDMVSLRELYSRTVTARWTAKLFLVANDGDLPRLRAEDDATWERVRRIPIGATIAAEHRDEGLRGRLESDASARSAVLAWCVAGAVDWYANGLGAPPASVRDAGAALRDEMRDYTATWIGAHLDFRADGSVAKAALRSTYEAACTADGEDALKPRAFASRLRTAAKAAGVELRDTRVRRGGEPVHAWGGAAWRADVVVHAPADASEGFPNG